MQYRTGACQTGDNMQNTAILLLAALVAIVPAAAQSPAKPWTLTLEERIALRTNPELARVRTGSAIRSQSSNATSANSGLKSIVDDFDGKTHPELFFPHEVFRELIGLAFLSPPRFSQVIREDLMPQVRQHGLPSDFWQRLEAVSAANAADVRAVYDLNDRVEQQTGRARERAQQALLLKNADVCRSRADALEEARKEFGRDEFDGFLYEVIAVGMHHASDRLPDPELLRQAERGCR